MEEENAQASAWKQKHLEKVKIRDTSFWLTKLLDERSVKNE